MQAFETAKKAIFDKDFVLEADRVEFKRGNFKYVTPSTNFVSLIDGKATVQLSFDGAFSGPNGIGGITVEGTPSNVEVETDKKGNVNFKMMVQGIGISASITIRMIEGSSKCTATVSPNSIATGFLSPERFIRVRNHLSLKDELCNIGKEFISTGFGN
mgnify:CR=1 FL=1